MEFLLILCGASLALGLFFIAADLFKLPRLATQKALLSAGRQEKKQARTTDVLLMGWAVKLAPHIHMDEYKHSRLKNTLNAAGLGMTPEEYTAFAIVKAAAVMLGVIPCLFLFPLLALVVILLAVMVYFKEIRRADEKLSGQVLISMDRTWAKCAWRMKKYPNILFFSALPILETENGIEVICRSDHAQKNCWIIMDATVEDVKTWIDNGWKKSDIIPDFLHVEGDASTICVLSHDLTAADNQTVASFTHTDVNNCIIRKEKNVFDRAEKTDFSESEACVIDDTGKNYQEYVIRISYDKAYDAAKDNIFLRIDFQADQAELYLNGEKIADQYYIGDVWEVSLKRFDFSTELILRLYPLEEDDKIYLETQPDYVNGRCCSLKDIRCVYECKEKL